MSDFDDDHRLTVVCTDGTTIGCANFTAKAGGVLLTEDRKRNRVFGFVPHERVRFVLPTDRAREVLREEETDGATAEADGFEDPLMRLPGLGSTYAKRLRSAGYATLEDLAGADPAALADETGANEERTERWVERANAERPGRSGRAGPDAEGGDESGATDEDTVAGEVTNGEDGESGDRDGENEAEEEENEGDER